MELGLVPRAHIVDMNKTNEWLSSLVGAVSQSMFSGSAKDSQNAALRVGLILVCVLRLGFCVRRKQLDWQ